MVRGGWVARPSPLRCPGKAVEGVAMAGGGGIRTAALPPRTLPAVGVHAGVPSLASEDVPPSHTRWAGRETEPAMTQGLPERPPPGHAAHARRHFVRDAVVFDDYRIAEGMVVPQGGLRRRYHPETCPTLPQQLARLTRGDTPAVLAFVRTYGLLGYAALAAAVGRGAPYDAAGDPLGWIWAHAETVALCLHLTYGLQAGDDAALLHCLRAVQLPQPPQTEGGPQLILPAVWDQPRVPFPWASPLHSPEDWRTYARAIHRDVLNAHLRGIHPPARRARGQRAAQLPLSGPHCRRLLASAPRQHP